MMQSAYLSVILHVSNLISPPIKYTSSCEEAQRLSTEGQIVSKHFNISKTSGEGYHQPLPPPPPLVLRVRPRG